MRARCSSSCDATDPAGAGTVTFDDLQVLDADGGSIPLEKFLADAQRYWTALHADDDRLSVNAQRAGARAATTWR